MSGSSSRRLSTAVCRLTRKRNCTSALHSRQPAAIPNLVARVIGANQISSWCGKPFLLSRNQCHQKFVMGSPNWFLHSLISVILVTPALHLAKESTINRSSPLRHFESRLLVACASDPCALCEHCICNGSSNASVWSFSLGFVQAYTAVCTVLGQISWCSFKRQQSLRKERRQLAARR